MTAPGSQPNPAAHLTAAPSENLETRGTDLPVAPAQPSDDIYRLPAGARRSYVDHAVEKLADAELYEDPTRARKWLERLAVVAAQAERDAESAQRPLVAAVESMQRRERFERAARRAERELALITWRNHEARRRARKNELARANYARRRADGIERVDGRLGMHACAIAVDPDAYSAVKLRARSERVSIPVMLGRVLHESARPTALTTVEAPRWRLEPGGRCGAAHERHHDESSGEGRQGCAGTHGRGAV